MKPTLANADDTGKLRVRTANLCARNSIRALAQCRMCRLMSHMFAHIKHTSRHTVWARGHGYRASIKSQRVSFSNAVSGKEFVARRVLLFINCWRCDLRHRRRQKINCESEPTRNLFTYSRKSHRKTAVAMEIRQWIRSHTYRRSVYTLCRIVHVRCSCTNIWIRFTGKTDKKKNEERGSERK